MPMHLDDVINASAEQLLAVATECDGSDLASVRSDISSADEMHRKVRGQRMHKAAPACVPQLSAYKQTGH